MDALNPQTKKAYTAPVLTPRGEVTAKTLGTNPITPREAVDLLGFDEDSN